MAPAPDLDWPHVSEHADPAPVAAPVAPTRALHSIDSRVAVALLGAVVTAVGSIGRPSPGQHGLHEPGDHERLLQLHDRHPEVAHEVPATPERRL